MFESAISFSFQIQTQDIYHEDLRVVASSKPNIKKKTTEYKYCQLISRKKS